MTINPLVLLTFFPLAGALLVVFLPAENRKTLRWTALGTSLVTFALSLWALSLYRVGEASMQLVINQPWFKIGSSQVSFIMGVDGISILLVLLTTFLTPISILSTWSAVQEHVKGFMLLFLLLESGMLGVFLALDLALFYIFWEFTLIPMIFLIGIWGGENKVYAAVKFFLFTMVGSVLMLLAILFLGLQAGTFSWMELAANRGLFAAAQIVLFLAFGVAFAIKVPMWPLHTWLPDAHVEAPTAGSVILAGVLLKMGAYGFLRFNLSLFPQATVQLAPWMAVLAIIGILYGAAVSYAQKDMKKLVAYSSVSHLGFVMLGIFALNFQGMSGAVLQMVNHGISTGALFLIVGMLYERRHTRALAEFGGVWKSMPVLGGIAMVVMLSSAGLPGLNGFVGEFTILLGAFGAKALGSPWFAGFATLGVILAAVYLLYWFEKVFFGAIHKEENRVLRDLNFREIITLTPLLIVIFWIGLYPKPFFNLINPGVEQLAALIQSAAVALH
ncbi:MAG: NADH-quinone oxidoreductase subunit M [Anaerolineaceae bacterium]|nr:NADH-quinone oxidoreductase subunit M [Anaerolineaceae bacterium]